MQLRSEQCSAVQFSEGQCRDVLFSVVQYSAVQDSTSLCSGAGQCSVGEFSAVQCSAVHYMHLQESTVQCSTLNYMQLQDCAVQCSALQ